MTKGRNTSIVSVRMPDEIVNQLKKMARNRRQSMTELLKPVIENFAFRGNIPRVTYKTEKDDEMMEEPPDLEEELDYWKENETKSKVKYPGTPRNALCPCGSGKKYKRCCGVAE